MATLKERLDAASEGRPSGTIPPEVLAWLEADRAAMQAGDRRLIPLEDIEEEHRRIEAENGPTPEARQPGERRIPPRR